MTIAIYLAHLNPLTNAHVDIINELKSEDEVVVMPVRFLIEKKRSIAKVFHLVLKSEKK